MAKPNNNQIKTKPLKIAEEIKDVTNSVVKKKQFELSDTDFEILNLGQYSKAAWEKVGRRHSIDPESRESLGDKQGRAFLATPKRWDPEPPQQGGVVTTAVFNANPNANFSNRGEITAGSLRTTLAARNLTTPEVEAISTEVV